MNFQNRINAVAQDVLAFRYANEGFKALRSTVHNLYIHGEYENYFIGDKIIQ